MNDPTAGQPRWPAPTEGRPTGPVFADLGPAVVDLMAGRRLVVVSGAGCSTDSGIPDYRGEGTRRRARRPVQYREFVARPEARQRYWARAYLGWPRFRRAGPNPAHRALARLEAAGAVAGVITQNVDRLHHAAGSQRVVELHGALAEVVCLDCGALETRDGLQARLHELNPSWHVTGAEMAPDGDADLEGDAFRSFRRADCRACGGPLKPNVVFFGENVPRSRSEAAWTLWDQAEVLLVVGSSLAVLSGYRFIKKAAGRGLPVVIVNRGPTRGDAEATVRIDAGLGDVLPRLADALIPGGRWSPANAESPDTVAT